MIKESDFLSRHFMLAHYLDQATRATPSAWSSLEVVKIIVSGLTPLAVVCLGLWINQRLKRFEHLQWARQKVIEKRMEIYGEVVPQCNDLLCYFVFVGCWKDLTPPDVVALKRKLDRAMHVNAPLFPKGVMDSYNAFVGLCFETYSGWGKDARLKTAVEERKRAAGDAWRSSWGELFTDPGEVKAEHIRAAYTRFVTAFASELGVGLHQPHVPSGRAPTNIQ